MYSMELDFNIDVAIGKNITDGAYDTMIQRITSQNNPNFFFMTHNNLAVSNIA